MCPRYSCLLSQTCSTILPKMRSKRGLLWIIVKLRHQRIILKCWINLWKLDQTFSHNRRILLDIRHRLQKRLTGLRNLGKSRMNKSTIYNKWKRIKDKSLCLTKYQRRYSHLEIKKEKYWPTLWQEKTANYENQLSNINSLQVIMRMTSIYRLGAIHLIMK